MFCLALIPVFFGLGAAHVCNKQGSELPTNTASGSRSVSLMQLKSHRQRSEVELVSSEDLAAMHAASSEQMRMAWEMSSHALKAVSQKRSEISLAQTPADTTGTNTSAAYHANASDSYDQQLGKAVNETTCQACAEAEQSLIEALSNARQGHITAQSLAATLSEARKALADAEKQVTDNHEKFVEEKAKLDKDLLTLQSPQTNFDSFVSIAQGLYPIAVLANQAESDRNAKTSSLQGAQTAYDQAANVALQLDATVTESRKVQTESCAALGLPTAPPTPAPAAQSCSNKADCLAKGWKLMWTGGEAKTVLPLGEITLIGYMTPGGDLLHAWHFQTPMSWTAEHPLDLFYDVTSDLEVTRLSDGLKYTGELVTSYGNYGGGCECGKGGGAWGRVCLRKPNADIGCGKSETRVPEEIDFPYLRAYGRSTCDSCICSLSHYNWNAGTDYCAGNSGDFVIFSTPADA